MPLTLYSAPVSPYGNVAEVALRLLEVEYKYVPTSPGAKNPAFRKVSPLARLPAADLDGFGMSDSDAIASYFDLKAGNKLYGNDPETRAKTVFVVKYAQQEGRAISVGVLSLVLKGSTDEELVKKRVAQAQGVLANLDSWVQDSGHFVGSENTMADVTVFCHLLAHITAGHSFEKYAGLTAFYNKMLQHPVFKQTHERSLAAIVQIKEYVAKKRSGKL